MSINNRIYKASSYIRKLLKEPREIGLVLGSGLASIGEELDKKVIIPYHNIPCFPVPTVKGHPGRLIGGLLGNKRILTMQGRFHYYEGYSMEEVTFPIRVMKQLGINTIIITNAAGGINPNFNVGDTVLITDHINFMGTNPLIGKNLEIFGPRFPNLQEAYSPKLIQTAEKVGKTNNIPFKKGVYAGVTGPSYETLAEIRMLKTLGADCVGMSTVPEVIVASHQGMEVLGISTITNTTYKHHKTSHEHVVQEAKKAIPIVKELLIETIKNL
ncbi:MAG TPA: purine-nucleoside phosphorylase [Thermoanaerobacterales bacterium]|nr:purine-nucleoside phosphorylase [Thermoanaerobacterales bacterium]